MFYTEYLPRLVFLFALGAVIGSYLNVCIYRLPKTEAFWAALRSLYYPPSTCPGCQRRIKIYDNVPIFGWLFLRGRCRFCRRRISPRYPLIELLTAVLFVLVYVMEVPWVWHGGIDSSGIWHPLGPQVLLQGWSASTIMHWRYAFHMVLIVALIAATFIDIDHLIIPDTVTLPAMLVGVLGNWLLGQVYLVPVWFQDPRNSVANELFHLFFGYDTNGSGFAALIEWLLSFNGLPAWITQHPHAHGLAVSLAGLVIGGGVVWTVRIIGYWVLRREAMGFGDVVLLAMVGSFIGWQPVLIVFFLAPVCALVMALAALVLHGRREIPYGPYLSLAALVMIVAWKWIWPVAEARLFSLGMLLPVVALMMCASLAGLLYVTRTIQRLLGIEWKEELLPQRWEAGDQLAYLAGECTDPAQGQWSVPRWEGTRSGRGSTHAGNWRRSPSLGESNAWQRGWERNKR